MLTEMMQTSEASTTTFKDDALELEVFFFTPDEESCVIFASLR